MCEEFQCLPSQARREIDDDPESLAERIVQLRAYARAKAAYDAADTSDKRMALPASPLLELVQEFDFALAAEDMTDMTHG